VLQCISWRQFRVVKWDCDLSNQKESKKIDKNKTIKLGPIYKLDFNSTITVLFGMFFDKNSLSHSFYLPLLHPRHHKISPREKPLYFYHSRWNQQEQVSVLSGQWVWLHVKLWRLAVLDSGNEHCVTELFLSQWPKVTKRQITIQFLSLPSKMCIHRYLKASILLTGRQSSVFVSPWCCKLSPLKVKLTRLMSSSTDKHLTIKMTFECSGCRKVSH